MSIDKRLRRAARWRFLNYVLMQVELYDLYRFVLMKQSLLFVSLFLHVFSHFFILYSLFDLLQQRLILLTNDRGNIHTIRLSIHSDISTLWRLKGMHLGQMVPKHFQLLPQFEILQLLLVFPALKVDALRKRTVCAVGVVVLKPQHLVFEIIYSLFAVD